MVSVYFYVCMSEATAIAAHLLFFYLCILVIYFYIKVGHFIFILPIYAELVSSTDHA